MIERRRKTRYPVELPARYRTLGLGRNLSGFAQTLNMSSGGVLVSVEEPIRPGTLIEVILDWPTLLDANIPLQLVTSGRVMHSSEFVCGIEFTRYQFRTAKRKDAKAAAAGQRS